MQLLHAWSEPILFTFRVRWWLPYSAFCINWIIILWNEWETHGSKSTSTIIIIFVINVLVLQHVHDKLCDQEHWIFCFMTFTLTDAYLLIFHHIWVSQEWITGEHEETSDSDLYPEFQQPKFWELIISAPTFFRLQLQPWEMDVCMIMPSHHTHQYTIISYASHKIPYHCHCAQTLSITFFIIIYVIPSTLYRYDSCEALCRFTTKQAYISTRRNQC